MNNFLFNLFSFIRLMFKLVESITFEGKTSMYS